jgi:hypothetical protein
LDGAPTFVASFASVGLKIAIHKTGVTPKNAGLFNP